MAESTGLFLPQTEVLVNERRETHGDWAVQAKCARDFKDLLDKWDRNRTLTPSQREALDMIAVKMSRILTGNPGFADHWQDIAGYARLGEQGHE